MAAEAAFAAVGAAFEIASFSPDISRVPTLAIDSVALPQGRSSRTYSGVGCWNSRGASLMTAIRAMLGDPSAYAESPDFTLRRLQLRFGKGSAALDAALHRRFDSSPYSSRPGASQESRLTGVAAPDF